MTYTEESEENFEIRRKNLLLDIECGALVTVIVAAFAFYIQGPIILVIATAFFVIEIFNIFDYCIFCRSRCKKPHP